MLLSHLLYALVIFVPASSRTLRLKQEDMWGTAVSSTGVLFRLKYSNCGGPSSGSSGLANPSRFDDRRWSNPDKLRRCCPSESWKGSPVFTSSAHLAPPANPPNEVGQRGIGAGTCVVADPGVPHKADSFEVGTALQRTGQGAQRLIGDCGLGESGRRGVGREVISAHRTQRQHLQLGQARYEGYDSVARNCSRREHQLLQ